MRAGETSRMVCMLLLSIACQAGALAGAFDSPTVSARGAGMGGSSILLTGDPASAFVNPASLTFLEETQFSIGTTVVLPNFQFTPGPPPGATTKMNTQVLFPPNFCLTHTFESGFALGVAVANPYSIKTDWGIEWPGRRVIAGSEMRGFVVTPMASFRLTRNVAMGLGLNVTSFRFVRSARVLAAPTGPEGTEKMQGTGTPAYGLQAGLLATPHRLLSFSVVYRSRSTIEIDDGQLTYEWPAGTEGTATSSKFATSFTLPDRIHAGVGFRPLGFLFLTGELEYVRWSSFGHLIVTGPLTGEVVAEEQWKDVLATHAGVEVDLGDVALRAGIMFDRSPIKDEYLRPSVPDADRRVYTVGIGYKIEEGLTLDVAFQSMKFNDRTITGSSVQAADGTPLNGTYVMNATNVCLNLSYEWK